MGQIIKVEKNRPKPLTAEQMIEMADAALDYARRRADAQRRIVEKKRQGFWGRIFGRIAA